MKKTLIALAALAAGTTAFAQSSVTLYGRVDMGLAHTTNVASGMVSGFNSPTLFGMKGSEDLGGGLKANFNLESENIGTNGAVTSSFFGRRTWVGLSGNFGAVQLGRQANMGANQLAFDLNGLSNASSIFMAGLSPYEFYGSSKRSAIVEYFTPNFSGFDAGIGYITAGDNKAFSTALGGGANSNGSRFALRLNYANGPIAAAFNAESAAASTNRTAYALGGSYDFGAAKVAGGYVRAENEAKSVNATGSVATFAAPTDNTGNAFANQQAGQGYYLGVSAPFGATTVGAQYANNTAVGVKAVELFANYNLSKRSKVYVDAVNVTSNLLTSSFNRFAVGLQHNF